MKMKNKHPKHFPSVALEDIDSLPAVPGVYFALKDGEVLYVGQSEEMRSRWGQHHKRRELEKIGDVRVSFLLSDGRPLLEQEAEWIDILDPVMNNARLLYVPKQPPAWLTWFSLFCAWASSEIAVRFVRENMLVPALLFGVLSVSFVAFCGGCLMAWAVARRKWKQ